MQAIPYPLDDDADADWRQQREEEILYRMDVGEILVSIDQALASEPDPAQHPLYNVVEYLLNRRRACSDAEIARSVKALCNHAIMACLDIAMQQDD